MMAMKDKALLLVDIQDSFKKDGRWDRRGNLAFEHNVSRLLEAWRAADLPRFFILGADPDPGFRISDPEFRLMEFMRPKTDEPVIVKTTRNSFTSTDLQQRLDALGIRRLVITGIQTEQCCETTTRVGADLGYEVDFVMDATQTFPIRNRKTGAVLPTEAIFERTDFMLRDRFARIVTTDEIVKEVNGALASTA